MQFFYRYSADGATYGDWTAYQTVTLAPYSVTFNYPTGAGYYEFYSVATDSNGVVEPSPAFFDTSTTFNVTQSAGGGVASDTPTLPQWALILLGVLLFGYAGTQLRTRMHLFVFLVVISLGLLSLVVTRVHASEDSSTHQSKVIARR